MDMLVFVLAVVIEAEEINNMNIMNSMNTKNTKKDKYKYIFCGPNFFLGGGGLAPSGAKLVKIYQALMSKLLLGFQGGVEYFDLLANLMTAMLATKFLKSAQPEYCFLFLYIIQEDGSSNTIISHHPFLLIFSVLYVQAN